MGLLRGGEGKEGTDGTMGELDTELSADGEIC